MTSNTFKSVPLSLFLAASIGFSGVAATPTPSLAFDPASTAIVNVDENGVGLHGYDPVAYFSLGVPVQGVAEFKASHAGVTYHFSSASHMDRFTSDPEAYTPQFGGFCQFGVALAKKLDGDPTVWRIADGQLFVYAYPKAKEGFLEDIPGNTVKADTNWPTIKKAAPQDL